MINDGKNFEKKVLELLLLKGWNASPEQRVGYLKVDIYAEKKTDFGNKERIIVECKDQKQAISKKFIDTKLREHIDLVRRENKADKVLLVTRNGLSPDAYSMVDSMNDFEHITYNMLNNTLMDFAGYIHDNLWHFNHKTSVKNYIHQFGKKAGEVKSLDLLKEIDKYVTSKNIEQLPMAILGGYGLGKTTLAKYITYTYMDKYANGYIDRIPIYIDLSQLNIAVDLPSLLGNYFTNLNQVEKYNYQRFLNMNSNGMFIVILDGFDEMKKAMSFDELKENFIELNKFVENNSKVILFGRPVAFFAKNEYSDILDGELGLFDVETNWPKYNQYEINFFTSTQIIEYVNSFVSKWNKIDKNKQTKYNNLINIIENNKNKLLLNLISRPVQLDILLNNLKSNEIDLKHISKQQLYSDFIDRTLSREESKYARKGIDIDMRRRFSSKLALYMYNHGFLKSIESSQIATSFYESFRIKGITLENMKRNLFSGSFLEYKKPDKLYFNHFSFLEYLVAEEIYNTIHQQDEKILSSITVQLSKEIEEFFLDMKNVDYDFVIKWKYWIKKKSTGIHYRNKEIFRLFILACNKHNIEFEIDTEKNVYQSNIVTRIHEDAKSKFTVYSPIYKNFLETLTISFDTTKYYPYSPIDLKDISKWSIDELINLKLICSKDQIIEFFADIDIFISKDDLKNKSDKYHYKNIFQRETSYLSDDKHKGRIYCTYAEWFYLLGYYDLKIILPKIEKTLFE